MYMHVYIYIYMLVCACIYTYVCIYTYNHFVCGEGGRHPRLSVPSRPYLGEGGFAPPYPIPLNSWVAKLIKKSFNNCGRPFIRRRSRLHTTTYNLTTTCMKSRNSLIKRIKV